eukprot:4261990-Pleurochrysis_carterae.AAC.4
MNFRTQSNSRSCAPSLTERVTVSLPHFLLSAHFPLYISCLDTLHIDICYAPCGHIVSNLQPSIPSAPLFNPSSHRASARAIARGSFIIADRVFALRTQFLGPFITAPSPLPNEVVPRVSSVPAMQ